jgi:hypothetical protein
MEWIIFHPALADHDQTIHILTNPAMAGAIHESVE